MLLKEGGFILSEEYIFNKDDLPNSGIMVSDTGEIIKPHYPIFPICTTIDKNTGEMNLLGTGFFITGEGLFVTAKHVVLENFLEQPFRPHENLAAVFFMENNHYLVRSTTKIVVNHVADLAFGLLASYTDNQTGQILRNKRCILDISEVGIGDMVATCAYPKSKFFFIDNKNIASFNTNYELGKITQMFPNGRDRRLLPGPCYETNMIIKGGASGGPVFNKKGKVIGVNSTGIEGTDISFVSRIHEVLSMWLPEVIIGNQKVEKLTVYEMYKRGIVELST